MNPFISIITHKRAIEVSKGCTAQGRDGVWRLVQIVKPKRNPNGTTNIIIGFAGGRTDAFSVDELVKTK